MARILLIDDTEPLRRALGFVLTRAGHEVDLAADGVEGLALFRQRAYDLLITDIFMPMQEGIATIRQVRASEPEMKIIAISGGASLEPFDPLKAASRLGADVTLQKPIRPDELVRAVDDLLS